MFVHRLYEHGNVCEHRGPLNYRTDLFKTGIVGELGIRQ
jgi:hypothetical protein